MPLKAESFQLMNQILVTGIIIDKTRKQIDIYYNLFDGHVYPILLQQYTFNLNTDGDQCPLEKGSLTLFNMSNLSVANSGWCQHTPCMMIM